MRIRTIGVLALALTSAGAWGQETVTASYNGYPVPIMPDYWDTVSIASVTVPKALKMTKVTAKVKIEYPQVGDLNVFLYSPDGTRVKLLERNCGSLRNVDTTFDDAASQTFAEFCPVEAGRGPYRGNEPLSNFNGADSSIGLWWIAVENNGSDTRMGRLMDVTLTITGTNQAAPYFRPDQVLNSANLRSGAVAPGQVTSIAGSALGPSTPVLTGAGAWPTTLGGVRVTVNGVDVPIRFASSTRLDVQMPFNLGTGMANIQVFNGSTSSSVVSVPIATTFPGLFSVQYSGAGQAKAMNPDGTLNSAQNPAPAGSWVVVWGVGLGAVNPAVTAGQVAPSSPLSWVTNTLAASIGGIPAPVTFAGLAPGAVGLYQVNLTVPSGLSPGAHEVIVSNAGNASQNGLVIHVK